MTMETIIGLEIHVQLKTQSKMFCRCSNKGENQPPNTTICPICLGHPGTLPYPNKQAIEWAVKAALALNCEIPHHSKFDRKHYFYPDLPKGYQISQYDEPIGVKGHLAVVHKGESRKVRIHRLHLEEDAAKLLHNEQGDSFVDFNRGGTPLMEIVTEADIRSPEEAGIFLRELRLIMRYLNVSDADMEKGHLRCDANVSLRPVPPLESPPYQGGDKGGLHPKTEVKNINSFKAVERALAYEVIRQKKLWEEEGAGPQEQSTRGWDENQGKTLPQRTKEEANDYRYFPEPDIPELDFAPEWVERLRRELPELPAAVRERFIREYGFSSADAATFAQDKDLASFAEETISELHRWLETIDREGSSEEIWERNKSRLAKLVSGWILSKLLGLLNAAGQSVKDASITPENMAELIALIYESKVNATNALVILEEVLQSRKNPSDILGEKDLGQSSDEDALVAAVDKVIAENPKPAAEYRAGKTAVLQFLVGLVMKATRGKSDASAIQDILREKLK